MILQLTLANIEKARYHETTYIRGSLQMFLIQDQILSRCGITKSERVLVAFSGGPDSLALLHEMIRLMKEGKIHSLAAAHLNHMIRGESADMDASFCRAVCSENDVDFYSSKIDVPSYAREHHLSIETAAREVRYEFLENIRNQHSYTCIALGHHKNDQAETLLLHLIRGSGTDGLAGMRYRNGNLVRPLLDCEKDEILSFLRERDLSYCTDQSNDNDSIERNNIRKNIIPLLESINPKIIGALSKTSFYVSLDSDYLNRIGEECFHSEKSRWNLVRLEEPILVRVLKRYLPYNDYDSSDIDTLKSILGAQSGTVRNLKYGYRAWVDSYQLHIDKKQFESFLFSLMPGETIDLPGKKIVTETVQKAIFPCLNSEFYIDLDQTKGSMKVRLPAAGDRFKPYGMKGTKLLSDYFTDRKVPRFERNCPLITDDIGIIAVLGGTIDDRVKITERSKKILHIKIEEVSNELGK